MVKLVVDNREIQAEDGQNLLQACLQNGIYIPNLCHIDGMLEPPASCRMCLVEIEGERNVIPSCTVVVKDGMVVKTDTEAVRRLQRSGLQLLLSVHEVDCGHCPANKKCELQRIAKFLKVGLKPKHLEKRVKETTVDEGHPFLNYYPNRCVLCGRCIVVCRDLHGEASLTFAKRGLETIITSYGEEALSSPRCETCHACVDICPVSAITLKPDISPQAHTNTFSR